MSISRGSRASILTALLVPVVAAGALAAQPAAQADGDALARGRYLVLITGCNDCHTEGYTLAEGKVPESEWLKGSSLGFRGPWGTTYGTNLRRYAEALTEDDWVTAARETRSRPPMPWWGMRDLTEDDLRAMYAFIRSLGPTGDPEPAYLPPDVEPSGPVVTFP